MASWIVVIAATVATVLLTTVAVTGSRAGFRISAIDQAGGRGQVESQYDDYVSYVCSDAPGNDTTGRQPLAGWENDGLAENDSSECTMEEVTALGYCFTSNVERFLFKQCQSEEKRTSSLCTLLMMGLFQWEKVKASYFPDGSKKLFVECDREKIFQLSRSVVDGCQLKRERALICPTDGYAKKKKCAHLWYAKQALNRFITVYNGPAAHRRVPCWEPDLLATERLYNRGGYWEISNSCVDVLEQVLRSILRYTFAELQEKLVPQKHRHGLAGGLYHLMRKVFEMFQKHSVDKIIGPMFRRMKMKAHRSRAVNRADQVTASCRKLRGTAQEASEAVLQLLRLTFVNELRTVKTNPATAFLASSLNHFVLHVSPKIILPLLH